jgi:Uma2 family endonuclease
MALQTAADIANKLPATFTAPGLTEKEFLALCEEYPDCFLEYTADGTVIILPPTDPESSEREGEALAALWNWARQQGHGRVSGSSGGFRFPDGSRCSPDAAWYDAERWRQAKRPGTRFPVFAPEFVIEVRSPDDKPRLLREKMEDYMANGVKLAWLVDPLERTVAIYRPGRAPEMLANPASVAGEKPVEGFVLDLDRVFA